MKKITLLFLLVLATTFGFAQNVFTDGTFDNPAAWTIIQQNTNNNATATIASGVATFDDVAQGAWGSEGHVAIYKAFTVATTGLYQFDADVTTNGVNEHWFELWLGTATPVDGAEYNTDSGAVKLLALNSWDCGATTNTYTGSWLATGCQGLDGKIQLDAGTTYYALIRTGGITWGTGIILDNVTLIDVTPPTDTDASLSDLKVDGVTISGFDPAVTSYTYELPYGTTTVPTVTVTTTEAGATPIITPASGIPGDTTIVVTAQDGTTQLTYTVSFSDTMPNVDATDPTYSQADVEALYSDTYTAPGNPDYNPGWNQATFMTEEVINGNNTLKYAGLNYQGITFDAMDVADRDYLHFDYWTADGTQFRASPISGSTGEVAYIITNATQNQWVSVDVPLSYFTGINAGFSFADISQFKFDSETFDGNGQGAGNNSQGFSIATFYVDNVYFHSGTLGVNDFQIEGLKVYPNPTNNAWKISTKDQVIKSIEIFNVLGKRVINLEPNALSTKVNASNLAPGVYFTKISTELGIASRKLIKQ